MASIVSRIRNFMRSPQGRRATAQGRAWASNPRNRQKLKDMLARRRR